MKFKIGDIIKSIYEYAPFYGIILKIEGDIYSIRFFDRSSGSFHKGMIEKTFTRASP